MWVVPLPQGEAERKVLLQPHPLPLAFAHSARSISQVSMFLETNVFVLLKNTSDGAWPHSCRKELELLSLQSGVQGPSALENPGSITTVGPAVPTSFLASGCCHHLESLALQALLVPWEEHSLVASGLAGASPGVLCASTTWLCPWTSPQVTGPGLCSRGFCSASLGEAIIPGHFRPVPAQDSSLFVLKSEFVLPAAPLD